MQEVVPPQGEDMVLVQCPGGAVEWKYRGEQEEREVCEKDCFELHNVVWNANFMER
ncbi:MAG: hypothetical protein R6U11_11670 [Bacteroidales bacterium]